MIHCTHIRGYHALLTEINKNSENRFLFVVGPKLPRKTKNTLICLQKITKIFEKDWHIFAYVNFFLYLCSRKGNWTKKEVQ